MLSYFGYGSNMNAHSLKAKGVVAQKSRRALLRNYELVFNVKHWFPHEGGVANVVPAVSACVQGVLHEIESSDLALLDVVESYGVGYTRIEVPVEVGNETETALTYVGMETFIDDTCLPTQRYMNILLQGAREAGIHEPYLRKLEEQRLFQPPTYSLFEPPAGASSRTYDPATLAGLSDHSALLGHVFDMSQAPPRLAHLRLLFGGRDMTLFFIHRHDTSTGLETSMDVRAGLISAPIRAYLNAYLHNWNDVFRYVGRLGYV